MRCLCIKLNVEKNNGPEYKGSQSQQTLPSLHIFHVHLMAWLPERASGANMAPWDLVPSGSSQGPWAWPRCVGRRGHLRSPLPCHRAGGKCLRTQLPIPALQRSWRSICGTAGDGHLAKDTDPRINPYRCLWAFLVSCPFSQPVDKTDDFVHFGGGSRILKEQETFEGRCNQLAIHQPSKHLGRVRVRHLTDGQFFPLS